MLSGQSTALYCSLPLADGLSHIDMDCAGLSGEQLGIHHPEMAAASDVRPSKQCWLEGIPDAPLWIQPGRLCCSAPRSTLQVIVAQLVNVFTWVYTTGSYSTDFGGGCTCWWLYSIAQCRSTLQMRRSNHPFIVKLFHIVCHFSKSFVHPTHILVPFQQCYFRIPEHALQHFQLADANDTALNYAEPALIAGMSRS